MPADVEELAQLAIGRGLGKRAENFALEADFLEAVRGTQQHADRRQRLAAVGQSPDERLKLLGGAAERRKLHRMLPGAGQDPLVVQALLPKDGRGAAEV